MLLAHIMKNLLYIFFPLAIPSSIALFTSEKVRAKKKIVLIGNLILFGFVVAFSFVTLPVEESLQVDWAFYALANESGENYKLRSLLGEGIPTFLGLEETQGEIRRVPVIQSGDQCQMRIRLNRKGYVYVFHFDTALWELNRLSPTEDVLNSNPMAPDSWISLPSVAKTWKFNDKPGFEVFLTYVSIKKPKKIGDTVNDIVETIRKNSEKISISMDQFQQQFRALAPCNLTVTGDMAHNLNGVLPENVKTYSCQAHDGKSALLFQFLRHDT
jgi:hypothetical protein